MLFLSSAAPVAKYKTRVLQSAFVLCMGLSLAAPASIAQSKLAAQLDGATGQTAGLAPTATRASPTPSASPTPLSTSPTRTASTESNPYGLSALWRQGDWVAKGCLLLLALMSMASWYALVSKALALRRLRQQASDAQGAFNDLPQFAGRMARLNADNPARYVADAGALAADQYAVLKPRVDYDTWLMRAIEQALSTLQTRLQGGMALLATVGSTAPFVGLFGTVWAIYTALVKIGASGQASIDRVAGPVGEALIMTAIGLAVAVPAVFGYNWLLRQNKLAFEGVRSFGVQLHSLLLATTDWAAPNANQTAQTRAMRADGSPAESEPTT